MQIYEKLKSRLDKFLGTLSRYSTILKIIAVDSIWRFKKESFLILITNFFGVFFQVWTIGLAIYYAHALEKGNNIKMLGYEFQTRNSIGLLFVCGMGALLSLLLSAWLIYFSRMRGLTLRRRYEEFCSKRVFALFGSNLKIWAPPDKSFSDSNIILRIARTDSRNIGRVLWMLLDTIIPVITLLVSVGVLFYTNAPLTFLMLVIFGISSIFQYKISVMGAKNSSLREKYARGASLEYQQIILRLKGTSIPLPEDESWFKENIFSGKIKQFLDAQIGRLKVVENSQLVSNILFAITIFVILLALGAGIILKGEGWGNLIVYLVALRFGLVNMKQSSKKITGINRFYPQIKRYFQFLENTITPPEADEKQPVSYLMTADTNPIKGSIASDNLCKGSRIGLVSTVELNRYTLAFIVGCMLGHSQQAVKSALSSMWFVTSKYGYLPGALRESLGLSPEYSWQDLHREMENAGLWNRVEEQLPHDLDKPISPDVWSRLDSVLKCALAMLNVINSNHKWVMIEEGVLQLFSETTFNFFMNRLSDRIMVIVFNKDTKTLGKYKEDIIAVMGSDNIIGLGSIGWFIENQHKIKDISAKTFNRDLRKVGADTDSDDEFDDEDI